MNYRDIFERALLTFAQAFLATFVVTDLATSKSAGLAGASALLSLLKGVVEAAVVDGAQAA